MQGTEPTFRRADFTSAREPYKSPAERQQETILIAAGIVAVAAIVVALIVSRRNRPER